MLLRQKHFFEKLWILLVLTGVAGCRQSSGTPLVALEPTPTKPSPTPAHRTNTAPTDTPQRTEPTETSQPVILELATPTPAPTHTPTLLACLSQGGRYENASLRDPRLPLPMEYAVYLPSCYDEQPERRYPVLYLIHGQNYNQDQWDRLGADETADELIASGELPPFLIVLPRDRSWAQPTEDMFGQVLVEGLLPQIDSVYRTIPQREYRAVGGLSRGAGWAVHLGLSHWELFGAIGAHSLPVFWADTPHIRSWLDAIPEGELPRIYMDIGEKDRPNIMASAVWFEELLTEKAIPHEWHLFPGYHEEAYWQANLERYLRWYAGAW